MKLHALIEVVRSLPKKKEGDSLLNHANYLLKLLESHHISTDSDISILLNAIQQDDFFESDNMPRSWSIRTYVSALAVLDDIFNNPSVLSSHPDIPKVLSLVNEKKKYYQREYKKGRRAQKEEAHQIVLDDDTSTMSEVQVVDDDLVSKKKVTASISYAISLIEKYMRHEPDEFKKAFLEVVCENLQHITDEL